MSKLPRPGSTRPRPDAWTLVALLALMVGLYLRSQQLTLQIVLDDEWHSLHKLLAAGPIDILTHFGHADYSIPLTLYERLLHDHGGLSELRMHAPVFVAGLALLVIGPWLVRDFTDRPTRAVWLLFLAISPLAVFYSRHARPYALTCLLALVAVFAFLHWWRGDRHQRAWAAAYAVSTCLAAWLSPVTLPFTLAPFAFFAIRSATALPREKRNKQWADDWLRLIRLGLVTGLLTAIAIGPPLFFGWAEFSAKAGTDWATVASVWRSLLMLLGTGSDLTGIAMAAVGARGVALCWRRDREIVAYLAFIILAALAATILARPAWIHYPLVLARYLIPAMPLLLLAVAWGLADLLQRIPWQPARPMAAILAAGAVFASGPLPEQLVYPTQFGAHLRYQFDYDPAHNPYITKIPAEPMPMFYRELAKLPPGTRTLIEAPWRLESHFNPHPFYQEVHRQMVKIGFVTPVCGTRTFGEYPREAGMHMRHFAHLPDVLRGDSNGADYLVMHLSAWKTPPTAEVEWPDVAACLPAIESALGPPVYRDDRLVVFALKPERRVTR